MREVRIISSSLIRAANHRESSRIELTPWDLRLLSLGQIQKGLLFPKPKPLQEKETDHQNTLIHHLKTSLSHTLDHFPALAGRLATTEHESDNTISYFLDCNNGGALFIHAAADAVTISDIIEPVYVPHIICSLFPLNGLKNYEGVTNPILGIQVTDLPDGMFIGCTINHSVADGKSFWHFFNLWSEISRGSVDLSDPPNFQRWFPDGVDLPIRIPKSHVKQAFAGDRFVLPPNLQERVFHFTKENISKLKAKANAEIGANNISSLQALLSHIWRSVIRNRILNPGEEITNYRILIGARERMRELPENYFGNAMLIGVVTMKAKELLKEGIGKVALEMNKTISMVTEESFKKFLESWPKCPKLVTLDSMTDNALATSSSPRFNMYGNDFGWGKPIAVRSGSANKSEGKITVFPGAEEGSIDIEACLSLDTLEAMAKDEEFVGTISHY